MPTIPVATGLAGIKALFDSTVRPLVGADGLIAIAEIADLALLIPSTVTQETYTGLSPAPGLKETVGDLVIKALVAGKLDLIVKLYEAALGIPRDDFSDDRIGLHRSRVQDMAIKATWHPHQLVAATLTANPTAFDETALFADSRADSVVGDFDNDLAPEMAGDAPTVLEMETALKAGISALKGFKDAEGDPINLAPSVGLLVPTDLEWQARACAQDAMLAAGTNTMKTNEVKGHFTPATNPFLASAVVCYLFVRDVGAKPLILQERESLTTESLGEGTDTWVKQKQAVFSARARRAMAAGHPGRILRMTFTKSE